MTKVKSKAKTPAPKAVKSESKAQYVTALDLHKILINLSNDLTRKIHEHNHKQRTDTLCLIRKELAAHTARKPLLQRLFSKK